MDVTTFATSLRDLDSYALLDRFGELVRRDHRVTAALLCCIAEIDRRELWAERGYSSLYRFCIEEFHMSEPMAGKRIYAARTMQRLPLVGEMVARAELHLTGVCMLGRHLTEENHREVLARARHRSVRELRELIAELAPKPDAPSRVSEVGPRRAEAPASPTPSLFDAADAPPSEAPRAAEDAAETGIAWSDGAAGSSCTNAAHSSEHAAVAPSQARGTQASRASRRSERRRGHVEPLSPKRYKLELTMSQTTRDKLDEAQALLSHQVPNGDPAAVFDRALDSLLAELRKKRTGATSRPRVTNEAPAKQPGARRSRHVPRPVRRAVWERDGGRCRYVSPAGKRCGERRWLELHHLEPFARGGEHTVQGLELRCRAHNQYEANRDYGRAFMDERRGRGPRAREAPVAYRRRLRQRTIQSEVA